MPRFAVVHAGWCSAADLPPVQHLLRLQQVRRLAATRNSHYIHGVLQPSTVIPCSLAGMLQPSKTVLTPSFRSRECTWCNYVPGCLECMPPRTVTTHRAHSWSCVRGATPLLLRSCCPCRTLSEPAPTRYADKAARAGGFISASSTSAAPWQVVQPAQPGMKQLEYRVLSRAGGNLPSTMWYV